MSLVPQTPVYYLDWPAKPVLDDLDTGRVPTASTGPYLTDDEEAVILMHGRRTGKTETFMDRLAADHTKRSIGPVDQTAIHVSWSDLWRRPWRYGLWLLDQIPLFRPRIRAAENLRQFKILYPFMRGIAEPGTPVLNNFFRDVVPTHVSTEGGHFGSNRTDVPRGPSEPS